jgi:hypothetical protein
VEAPLSGETKEENSINLTRARFCAEVAGNFSTVGLRELSEKVAQELRDNHHAISKEARDAFGGMEINEIRREVDQLSLWGKQAAKSVVFTDDWIPVKGVNNKFLSLDENGENMFGVLFSATMGEHINLARKRDNLFYDFVLSRRTDLTVEGLDRQMREDGIWEKKNPVCATMSKPVDIDTFNGAVEYCIEKVNEINSYQ